MKETDNIQKDQIENVKQVEVQKQLQLHDRRIPKKGHTLFEINKITGQVVKAELVELKEVPFEKAKRLQPIATHKVIMKENCFYVSALNIKNLFRKLGFVIKK